MEAKGVMCRFCHVRRAGRNDGRVCQTCRKAGMNKERAGHKSRAAVYAMAANMTRNLDVRPTDALPGTEEKIRIMGDRHQRLVAIFHPGDPSLGMNVDGMYRLLAVIFKKRCNVRTG